MIEFLPLLFTDYTLRTVALVCLLPITFPLLVLPGLVVLHTHAMALARRTADATLDVRLGDAALVAALIVCAGPLLIPLSPIAGQLWLAGAVIATLRLMHRWFELDGHLGVAACWAETEDRRRGTSADPA